MLYLGELVATDRLSIGIEKNKRHCHFYPGILFQNNLFIPIYVFCYFIAVSNIGVWRQLSEATAGGSDRLCLLFIKIKFKNPLLLLNKYIGDLQCQAHTKVIFN